MIYVDKRKSLFVYRQIRPYLFGPFFLFWDNEPLIPKESRVVIQISLGNAWAVRLKSHFY